jgi:hypothetical protein
VSYIHGPLKWFYLFFKLVFFWVRPEKQTDLSYQDGKLTTAICGYCNHRMSQEDFNRWLGDSYTAPNPIVFKEALVFDRIKRIHPDLRVERNIKTARWATQYQSPLFCRGCGEIIQNSYAMKIMRVLVVVFY